MSDALRWHLGSLGADLAIRWAIEGRRRVETPRGQIIAKRRFRTLLEAYDYAKAAQKRALLRAGKDDCW